MTLTIKPPAWRKRFGEPPQRAMVLVSAELLLDLVDRTNPDAHITLEWGEPVDPRFLNTQPVYEPEFTLHQGEP